MTHARIPIFALLLAVLLLSRPAHAFNSSSFNGTADFYAGAAPPPGLHLIDYNVFLDIKKVENKGQGLTDGDGSLTAVAFRPIYVSEKGLFGGNFLMHSIIPILSAEANVTAQTPGGPINVEGHDGGLGDIYFGAGLAWHTKTWHWLTVLDVITPTGSFDATKPINAGNNAFIIEPVIAVTGLFDNGIEASAKLMYSYHTKNSDYIEAGTGLKGYQTGQAIHMDYMLNYAVAPSFKLGVTGWVWQGLEDDKIGGTKRPDTKDREFSIGPAARYQNGKFALLGKYVIPVSAENRIEANQTWIDLVYSF
uniref:Phenol degradation-like protein n=1 Tax=Geobacter sp. (strain M21) TaxID=443144 RepID=C6E1Z4_GEOSM